MPYRHLHLDEKSFGVDPKTFDVGRFLNNQDLSRSPNFRPFGGGLTICSGRFIAKRQVLSFVAMVVHRYDLGWADSGQGFPRMDETKPTLGIMDPVKDKPLTIVISPRK